DLPRSGPRRRTDRLLARSEVLDVFIEGANVTARVTERQAGCVLRDLGAAVAELGGHPNGKRIVRFYEEAWELAVERQGARACLSVYRAGNEPKVFVYDRWVSFRDVVEGVVDALGRTIETGGATAVVRCELERIREALARVAIEEEPAALPPPSP